MSSINRDPSRINAGLTFISVIMIGVILAVYVVKDEQYRAPIIISFFLLAFFLTGLELVSIVKHSNKMEEQEKKERKRGKGKKKDKKIEETRKKQKELKMAKYVAELFNEDIPFEELEDPTD